MCQSKTKENVIIRLTLVDLKEAELAKNSANSLLKSMHVKRIYELSKIGETKYVSSTTIISSTMHSTSRYSLNLFDDA